MNTKYIIVSALLVSVSSQIAFASIDHNLKYGQKNSSVLELQEFLIDKGFLQTQSKGFFGLLTLKAVKAYQTSLGLPSTGYVGSLTREKINNELVAILQLSTQAEAQEVKQPQAVTTQPVTTTQTVVSPQLPVTTVTNNSSTNLPTQQMQAWVSKPTEISIQTTPCNLSGTNLKETYSLGNLLSYGNTDGRIFMNAYVLNQEKQNYYSDNPADVMTITTSNHSNDKTLTGSGATSPCGYYYPYEFYTTQTGTYTITYSIPKFNLLKTITLNVTGAEKPIIGSSGITISTPQKETDYPLSELANLTDSTSSIKYWFQTSKPNYSYNISALCSDADTSFSKVDVVSHLEQDGLYYYRGYFRGGDKFSGVTTCKFVHSTDSPTTISSESDIVTFNVK